MWGWTAAFEVKYTRYKAILVLGCEHFKRGITRKSAGGNLLRGLLKILIIIVFSPWKMPRRSLLNIYLKKKTKNLDWFGLRRRSA